MSAHSRHYHEQMRRHRRFQCMLTAGCIVTAAFVTLAPHYAAHATWLGTMVSLAWIWEK